MSLDHLKGTQCTRDAFVNDLRIVANKRGTTLFDSAAASMLPQALHEIEKEEINLREVQVAAIAAEKGRLKNHSEFFLGKPISK